MSTATVTVTVTLPQDLAYQLINLYARAPQSTPPRRLTPANVRKHLANAIIHFARINARRAAQRRELAAMDSVDAYAVAEQRDINDLTLTMLTVLDNARKRSDRATAKRRAERDAARADRDAADTTRALINIDW